MDIFWIWRRENGEPVGRGARHGNGETTARHLQGFGCRVLAYDRREKPALQDIVEQTDLDTVYRESDILSLHLAAAPETYHFIDSAAIAKMKDGAVLINTARGTLVDNAALIDA